MVMATFISVWILNKVSQKVKKDRRRKDKERFRETSVERKTVNKHPRTFQMDLVLCLLRLINIAQYYLVYIYIKKYRFFSNKANHAFIVNLLIIRTYLLAHPA